MSWKTPESDPISTQNDCLKILIITSCTGEKTSSPANQLTLEDFAQGGAHLAKREKELKGLRHNPYSLEALKPLDFLPSFHQLTRHHDFH